MWASSCSFCFNEVASLHPPSFQRNDFSICIIFREKTPAVGERPLPETPSSISLPPMDLFQQLQEQLHKKHKLYRKHDIQLSRIIGEGKLLLVHIPQTHEQALKKVLTLVYTTHLYMPYRQLTAKRLAVAQQPK